MTLEDIHGRKIGVVGVARVVVNKEISVPATTDYAAEDVISDSATAGTYLTFSNVVSAPGGSGTIVGAICLCQTTNQSHLPTLLLFNTVPTGNLNDNAANTSPVWADRSGYLGKITFPAFSDRGGVSETQVVPGEGGLPKPFKCIEGSRDIYGILITEGAITAEKADDDYFVSLLVDQN